MNINKISNVSLILVFVFLPFYFVKFSIAGISFNIVEVLILICILLKLLEGLNLKKINFGSYWVYIFLFLSFIAIFFSDNIINASGIFKGWFLLPILFYLYLININKKYNLITIGLIINLIFVLLIATGQKLRIIETVFYQIPLKLDFEQYLENDIRVFGPFDSPNFLAMYIVPVILIILALAHKTNNKILNLISWILGIWTFVILYWTGSAGGGWALIGAILVILILTQINNIKLQKITLAGFAALGVTGYYFMVKNDSIRLELLNYTWKIISQNPIFGIGLGDFQNHLNNLDISDSFRGFGYSYSLHPHNLFLAHWLYLGLFGLILFCIIVFNFLKSMLKELDLSRILLISAMVAIIIHGLVDTTYYKNDLAIIFWLIIALSINLKNENLAKN